MPRLIDADKLGELRYHLDNSPPTEWQQGWNDAIDTIMGETPTVDAEPVRQGRWLWVDGVRCSICNHKLQTTGLPSYCPNCGAKMDGERREDGNNDRN